jgi:hypothetical protein
MGPKPQLINYAHVVCLSGCHQNSRKVSKASQRIERKNSYILTITSYDGCDAPLLYLTLKWEPT